MESSRAQGTRPANQGGGQRDGGSIGESLTPAEPIPPANPPLASEAELRALLDRWVKIQNSRNLEAYERLFAKRFQGVKRAGPRVYRMDRYEWLADRKQLFVTAIRVEAQHPTFQIGQRVATIRFGQQWAAKTYEDVGEKELLVVRENGALRIAREEVLESKILASTKNLEAASGLAFVVEGGGPRVIVSEQVETPAARGLKMVRGEGGGYTVVSPIDVSKLPKSVRAWEGKHVRVTFHDGHRCMGQVKGLSYLAHVIPYSSEEQLWRGTSPDGKRVSQPWTDGQIAHAVWNRAHFFYVTGSLELDQGADCKGEALFARDADRLAFPIADRLDKVPYRGPVMATFRRLDEYKKVLATHVQNEAIAGRVAQQEKWEKNFAVEAFRLGDGEDVFVSVRTPPAKPCSKEDDLWVVYRVHPDGRLRTEMPPARAPKALRLLFDADGDGHPEFLVQDPLGLGETVLSHEDRAMQSWTIDYQDCPC